MSTESDTLPETPKVEPEEMIDPDIDILGPFQNQQARTLAKAAKSDGVPFCEKCKTVRHAQAIPQGS